MDNEVADDVEEMRLIIDVSYVDLMMRCICCMSRELYLSTYSGHLYIVREDMSFCNFQQE
jgi:hypothetical protein